MKRNRLTYRDSGVDLEAAGEMVQRISHWVKKTYTPNVLPRSHGSFGGFYRLLGNGLFKHIFKDPVLVGATDGVGTKLRVAFEVGRLDTVGIDLVAMCVNDLVVGGARPLFFLDYIATDAIEPRSLEKVVRGIAEGCLEAGCALLGGETAEMPGFYRKGEFDLAGFSVGIVERRRIIDGGTVAPGDLVIGLPSSGLHSNGFSLVRRALLEGEGKLALRSTPVDLERPLGEELLTPTRIYVKPLLSLYSRYRVKRPIHAVAHITGGGLMENIPRVLPSGCGVELRRRSWKVPPIFPLLQRQGKIETAEMDRVFNQGLGMVLIVAPAFAAAMVKHLQKQGEEARIVGEVVRRRKGVYFLE